MRTIRRLLIATLLGAALLTACAGGSIPQLPSSRDASPAQKAEVTFSIKIPRKASQAVSAYRRPQYVSANTQSLAFLLNTVNGATPSPAPTALSLNVTSTTNGCAVDVDNSGNYVCTIHATIPVGTDAAVITAYDQNNAAGNILSQGTANFTVTPGTANTFSLTMDANPSGITVVPPSWSFVSGTVGGGLSLIGSATQNFTATLTDPSGATIVGPGNPIVSASSANSSAISVSSTPFPGFNLNVQGFTGSPVQITVNASPPAGSGFSSLSTSFSVSETPLIAIAYNGSGSGQVRLYTPGSGTSLNAFGSAPISAGAGFAYAVAFGPTGTLVVGNAGGGANPYVSTYSVAAQIAASPAPQATSAAASGQVQGAAVYTDGTIAAINATTTSNQLLLFANGNLASRSVITMPSPSATGYKAGGLAFLPNGKSLVSVSTSGQTGAVVMVPAGATNCTSCTQITSNVNQPAGIAVDANNGDFYVANGGGSVTRYNESGTYQNTAVSGIPGLGTIALSPDGTYAAYGSVLGGNYSVTIVNRSAWGTPLCTGTVGFLVRSVAWLPDDTLIATSNNNVSRFNTSCSSTAVSIPVGAGGTAAVSL